MKKVTSINKAFKKMKIRIFIITLFLLGSIISSCSSDDDINYQSDFENSHSAWVHFKKSSHNSYKYVIGGGSVFTTYGWETTIKVSNGVIIERAFRYTAGAEDFIPIEQLEWTENESEINSPEHENTSASTALTMDEIYVKAQQEWLIKRKDATSYFEAENNGLISTCGYTEKNCLDDCFVGIRIKSIESL